MADRKVTVVNPAGYQEQLPDSDNLLLVAAPTLGTHGVNKTYTDTKISDLENSVDTDVSDLQGKIDAEEAARIAADETLQGNIDAEEAARIAADEAEASARAAADAQLQSNIDAEASARAAADANLQSQIDAIDVDSALQTLQQVTDKGSSTTTDITVANVTSTAKITAVSLEGDIDQGEY